jgi:hypothetical protein
VSLDHRAVLQFMQPGEVVPNVHARTH